jgi:hypothetical protein
MSSSRGLKESEFGFPLFRMATGAAALTSLPAFVLQRCPSTKSSAGTRLVKSPQSASIRLNFQLHSFGQVPLLSCKTCNNQRSEVGPSSSCQQNAGDSSVSACAPKTLIVGTETPQDCNLSEAVKATHNLAPAFALRLNSLLAAW